MISPLTPGGDRKLAMAQGLIPAQTANMPEDTLKPGISDADYDARKDKLLKQFFINTAVVNAPPLGGFLIGGAYPPSILPFIIGGMALLNGVCVWQWLKQRHALEQQHKGANQG